MSNLGIYQKITTISKKVGGPINLLAIVATSGYIVGKGCEILSKRTIKILRDKRLAVSTDTTYEVIAPYENKNGLKLSVGDKYKILESDEESVLIEKLGDSNNPYFVSLDILKVISDDFK